MPKIGMQSIRKQQLIDATLAVVNEVGMQDASIAQIARKAGVSNGIISHYFKDKNGLLEATMRYLLHQLGMAVARRLRLLDNATPAQRLKAIVEGNFDASQISSAAMKTWLAFWASSIHQPNLYRLQQVNERRLYSNICVEFRHVLPKAEARLAAQGLAALIDGIWLRSALSSKPFDIKSAFTITLDYIEQKLGTPYTA
ncbi:transcriptional regulator BetI [Xenorhabdus bovienii]|uniref:HTH-type transcriptional regulator BetI n=1 Tax=Xenorhabdus bovienii str. Intermedium TaxID=1379677 RepID=A0A077QC20_XENBV|nr:transcriptional regulator BetI [Xenorhabdus bovienii]MDE1483509.1 transcriptional regulator BetI [Xenorhabdus bovienii]MDE9429976.1 transcriptional regulator BetI [Xenorhabdus bovienii]MDE9433067.1 transcriptional regulator BetI [Xenorhabdus bovienii]MDE9436994.1 transcriptional regulator BetI [Xenorhabdus bovienii]MDE9442571.1 transcriptional regulator BetI [Xenorhabdus bovienii]